jgi:hypothetical protein
MKHDELDISRREFMGGAVLLLAGLTLPGRVLAKSAAADPLAAAATSPLIYISPMKSNGLESRCHAEVWFVKDDRDLLVVTSPDRWRAACIGKGLDQARIWVGDFGVWKKSEGAYREAPNYLAKASIDGDPAVHARVLEIFGSKYPDEWDKWGPRFSEGLASGERVLIRYTPVS